MTVGEIFLSAFVNLVFQKLFSPEVINFARREGIHTTIKKWTAMVMKIQAVLNDAEEKQINNLAVKNWLDELQELAYDVEDVLDEFATESLRCKAETQVSTGMVRSLISSCCISFKPSTVMFNFNMESKLGEITCRLQDIVTLKRDLELKECTGGTSNRTKDRHFNLTSSLEDSYVCGREKDKEAILELLLRGETSDGEVCVIPIIGMGGVGKTTLAQLVYNDDKVNSYFDMKAWVCVSEEFDVIQVTKEILQKFTSQPCSYNDLDSLQVILKKKLSKRKFMLVLDDVWHENYNDWTTLRRPLEAGAPGSKIIVTARNQHISDTMGTIPTYNLKELSNDDCLYIFTKHALRTRDFSAHPNLKQIGEEIVKRCKGLPLAAKALGGLLRTKVNLNEWKDVLNSKLWDLPESGIIPALRLSYHNLPPHLKQCFAYCSIFPKDYEFEEEKLVLLWMAVGLVQKQNERKQMEDIGAEYFRDLLSRSFFQLSSTNKSRYVMHDLINDLAQWIAGETYFMLEDKLEGEKQYNISKKARHSSYVGSKYDGVKKFEAFHEVKSLQTFLPLLSPTLSYLTSYVPLKLLPELRCLRVLSLRGYRITKLPNSIGDLKHLRYLDLSYTEIRSLPESISTLYNLQTLILTNCFYLKKLPTTMEILINLRFLDITNVDSIEEMPPQVGKLTSLQILSNFIIGNDSGSGIRELMNLKYLQGTLRISRLENVIDARGAREANLKDKQYLDGLTMGWSSDFNDLRNNGAEKEVIDMLQPHKKLKELTIKCYGGLTFPAWVGDPSFINMVVLRLENCVKCTSVPPLGQLPLLKDLCIEGMNGVNSVGLEFNGEGCPNPFPSLETLSFENMKEWMNWFPSAVDGRVELFPCLRKLLIFRCPNLLGKLPDHLLTLEKLVINECPQLAFSISNLPSLEKLVINKCPQLLVSISSLPVRCELDIRDHQEVVKGSVGSLKSMVLSSISKLSCLMQGFVQGLAKVEDLKIVGCDELTSLWQKEVGLLQHLTSLRRLRIDGCPKFVSLVAEEVEQQQQQQQLGVPWKLESLGLYQCDTLEKLQGLQSFTSLRELTIEACPRLMSFPDTGLLSMLRSLQIKKCNALKSLPLTHYSNYASLEYLCTGECPSLKSLSSRSELPAMLKDLRIDSCPKLESIVEKLHNNTSLEYIQIYECESLKCLPEGLHNLSHLSKFDIDACPSLVSFPDGGLPATNLGQLRIKRCQKLDALPLLMHNLTSLQHLSILQCPSIVSFPEGGFPTNLTQLVMRNVKICKPLFEWGLHRLTSLKTLYIEGGCPELVSFPEEEKGMLLPTSLTKLVIPDFPNLEYLSLKGFQNLTSLKELWIFDCPQLKYFLDKELPHSLSKGFQNLSSLEYLWIDNCPKFKSFPEEGLPPSLLQLYIYDCPLLKQRCKKDQGQDWSKIAHIPCVCIDYRFIHDPEHSEE